MHLMNLEHFATQFYDTGYFGAYPSEECIQILEKENFELILKLTSEYEKNISKYEANIPIVCYPIKDNSVPQDWDNFSWLICYFVDLLRQKKKIFIHCKGGHGRSCIVISCLLYCLNEYMNARESIENAVRIHNQRSNLSIRWKDIKSPLSKTQYVFLYKFLNVICLLKSYNIGYQAGFSGSSSFEIKTEHGVFSNLDAAFQSSTKIYEDGEYDSYSIMLNLTRIKYESHPELIPILLTTGIRKIYDFSRYAFGNNLVGKSLVKIREEYMIKKFEEYISLKDKVI